MSTIEGIWHSRYEYGRGANDEPQTSEHVIEFTRQDESWTGKSLPNKEGSEISLTLKQNGGEFKGDWQERTSPTGSYGGREFGGAVLLLLQNESNQLNGMWLGAGSDNSRVKSGTWTLKRVLE